MPSTLLVKTVVRGHHVYKVLWEPQVGETIIVVHETGNEHDRHAMAVYRDENRDIYREKSVEKWREIS